MFASAPILLALILTPIIYRIRFHPLSHVPGPIVAKVSSLFLHTICYLGVEGRVLRYYHLKYKTKVLRVAPNSVSISDSEAVRDIYIAEGGFAKDERYRNFNLGPIVSIFSSMDTAYRDVRAKAVAPLFSPAQIRVESGPKGIIGSCVSEFVSDFCELKAACVKTDILDLSARLSIDVVTAYLLGRRYGGLNENKDRTLQERQMDDAKLSANPFIFAIVAFARFSLLPNRIFRFVYAISQRLSASEKVTKSFITLDHYAEEVIGSTITATKPHYYHERLVQAGVSRSEAGAQSKAIIFAGADSTAVMLSTTLFHLVRSDSARVRLVSEVRSAKQLDNGLPFLRAVVKEGLRLGMANPTRLTRVVPASSSGLRVGDVVIPPGTIVGCAAYNLHHDPDVFPEPFAFRPERWLDDGTDQKLRRPGMERSMIPFGAGLRACIGKNLAMHQLHETVKAVVESEVLEGARTCQEKIEVIEWFNGDIKGHRIDIEWQSQL